jgi:phosphopantothenoylcysteine synthetase/decarboxylase
MIYFCNGYKFHTETRSNFVKTVNHGVCVRGGQYEDVQYDYYGIIEDIIILKYSYTRNDEVVLFKCRWFDPVNGVKEDKDHGLVEIKYNSRLKIYEPFVCAHQADQVYYLPYASKKRRDWRLAVKCRRKFNLLETELNRTSDPMLDPFQEDDDILSYNVTDGVDLEVPLNEEGVFEEIINLEDEEEEGEEEEEEEEEDNEEDNKEEEEENDGEEQTDEEEEKEETDDDENSENSDY